MVFKQVYAVKLGVIKHFSFHHLLHDHHYRHHHHHHHQVMCNMPITQKLEEWCIKMIFITSRKLGDYHSNMVKRQSTTSN